MKKSRFTEEQIGAIPTKANRDEKTIGDVCRTHGVEPMFYKWRNPFRGGSIEN